ncbi:MAG: hypothetical protein R3C60_02385 [Parvularculaceae bacterium]
MSGNVHVKEHPAPSRYEDLESFDTPCYLFNPATVISDYLKLKNALGTPLIVSLKANPNIDLFVRCAHIFEDGVELASLGELVLMSGRAGVPKIVNTPALDAQLLAATLASRNATVILDNPDQVDLLLSLKAPSKRVTVGLRLNACSFLDCVVKPAHEDHFGVDLESLCAMASRLQDADIDVSGIHVYGGPLTFENYGLPLAEKAPAIINEVTSATGKGIEFLNLGGGFSADWDVNSEYFRQYREAIEPLKKDVVLWHEAGRAIFRRGGSFFTKVLAVKRLNGRHVAICDGGMAQAFLLAQTENFLRRPSKPVLIPKEAEGRPSLDAPVVIAGSSCNRADIIGELTEGLTPKAGDILRFDDCGAYHTYSPVGFLNLKQSNFYIMS